MYRPESTVDEALAELEAAYRLGGAARVVNRGLRILLTGLAIPATPVGCLLGFVHAALMLVTFGIYALLWSVLWLPFLGVTLGTSWLWSKAPILWPVWVVVGVPFLLVAYVLALLGPQDVGGEDKMAKLGMLMAWPYTFFVMFPGDGIGQAQRYDSTGTDADDRIQRGIDHGEAGDYRAALADFSQAIALAPNSSEAYTSRGYAHYRLGNYDEAVDDLQLAIELATEFPLEAHTNLGLVWAELGETERAIEKLEMAVAFETSPDIVALLERRIEELRNAVD